MSTDPALLAGNRRPLAGYRAEHFLWAVEGGIGTITLNRPERKNPLTFDSYAELRDLFQRLRHADDVSVVLLHGAGGNFCSGGDVHEIIGPLIQLKAPELLMFTRMTGDLVKHMRACPQPIIAAVENNTPDCVIIFDTDVDRAGAVDKKGKPIFPPNFQNPSWTDGERVICTEKGKVGLANLNFNGGFDTLSPHVYALLNKW